MAVQAGSGGAGRVGIDTKTALSRSCARHIFSLFVIPLLVRAAHRGQSACRRAAALLEHCRRRVSSMSRGRRVNTPDSSWRGRVLTGHCAGTRGTRATHDPKVPGVPGVPGGAREEDRLLWAN